MISRPTPVAKWPLQAAGNDVALTSDDLAWARGPAPQRPARPSVVPSILDSSKVQEYAPSMPCQTNDGQEEEPLTPDTGTFSAPGRPLTASSCGTVSDFLLPDSQTSQQPSSRKSSHLGPPPSARRGDTSFYSIGSNVSPIPEESPQPSPRVVNSFASSKVIPSSWGSAPRGSEIVRMYENMPDNTFYQYDRTPSPQDEEVTLVRQASLGKRGKPLLRTLSKCDSEPGNASTKTPAQSPMAAQPPRNPVPVPANMNTAALKPSGLRKEVEVPQHPLHGRSYSFSSDSSLDDLEKPPIPMMAHPTLKELEMEDTNNFNQRKRRPPRLDLDAVRDAEARGSLTSLPELIRRATRLAGNLDRGKTASRFGMLDMLNAGGDGRPRRQSGSISDILASFPPPGVATPDGSRAGGHGHRANPNVTFPEYGDHDREKQGRRCCGMRRSVFILILLLLIIIIAAAVLIPVFLIVLPRMQEASDSAQPGGISMGASKCEEIQPCMNGGVSIGTKDSCGCVCVDGFRGSDCAISSDRSCTTIDISDDSNDYHNATIGSAIPRLIESAELDFNIPLDASKIIKLFNAEDISCTSENAIVTFNGANRKREAGSSRQSLLNGPRKHPRQKHPTIVARGEKLEDVEDDVPTPTNKPTASSTSTSTSTSTSSPSSSPTISSDTLDFARIAVLYMFQRVGDFSDALTAQEKIQKFLKGAENVSSASASETEKAALAAYLGETQDMSFDGFEFELDFVEYTIGLADGTVVGGGK